MEALRPRSALSLVDDEKVFSPFWEIKYFHSAIKCELGKLHQAAIELETGMEEELKEMFNRHSFLRKVYRYHVSGEDEVIFPALDLKVKNIARAYSLEHRAEANLFEEVSGLLTMALQLEGEDRAAVLQKLVCCSEALHTCLDQHLSKEEEQILPLLMKHFTREEQSLLVWQLLCCIPVNLMENYLQWMASSLSQEEFKGLMTLLESVVPGEDLRQHILCTWLNKKSPKAEGISENLSHLKSSTKPGEMEIFSPQKSPINELVHWHTAIKEEIEIFLRESISILNEENLECSTLAAFFEKYRFLADVCHFHSTAEENVLFVALERIEAVKLPRSFHKEHLLEEEQFLEAGKILEEVFLKAQRSENNEAKALFSQLSGIIQKILKSFCGHISTEEQMLLPLVEEHCSISEQRLLLYKCLREMPLRLLEKVLPWIMGSSRGEEGENMVTNIKLAAPQEDSPLVQLFLTWALNPESVSSKERFFLNPKPLLSPVFPISFVHSNALKGSPTLRPLKRLKESVSLEPLNSTKPLVSGNQNPEIIEFLENVEVSPLNHLEAPKKLPDLGSGNQTRRPIDAYFQFHSALRKDLENLELASLAVLNSPGRIHEFAGKFHLLRSLYRAHSTTEDEIVFPALEERAPLHNVSHSYSIDHKQEENYFEDIEKVVGELEALEKEKFEEKSQGNENVEFGKSEKKSGENWWEKFGIFGGNQRKLEEEMRDEIINSSDENFEEDEMKLKVEEKQEEGGGTSEGNEKKIREEKRKERENKRKQLAKRLRSMCTSIRFSLDQHVSREEEELLPLFEKYFSEEEQNSIMGRIIGNTGAEVLQAMLPWISKSLSEEDSNEILTMYRQASKNTMFDQWLNAWWKEPNKGTKQGLKKDQIKGESLENSEEELGKLEPETAGNKGGNEGEKRDPDPKESLQLVAEYLESSGGTGGLLVTNEGGTSGSGSGFRPGWQEIFRMNLEDLEKALRKVSSDDSLDPRKKAYLMQNLMTSRWLVAQQRDSPSSPSSLSQDLVPTYHDEPAGIMGCEHYRRKCRLKANCCERIFTCRFCHDKVSDHTMERQKTEEMMCMKCLKLQPVAENCNSPSCEGLSMARYFCKICKLFDDDNTKPIYHCPFCNLCRVGRGLGVDYFHCLTCNACMALGLQNNHICREKGLESNCPICHDFLFTSNTPVKALPCAHFMHSACFQAYTCSHYTCPVCLKSLGDMSVYFGMLDALLASEELPEEYKNKEQDILCNDCAKKSVAPFHWLYHKCKLCGSYNTKAI